ncbi:hypothetical protein OG992_08755 [Micromonospora sp. NBC_00362]|uniref:hypothetical protein n=1 Tax=Micromonospora sp. NBC_00362 TaxID=2975975 RepID=UPI00225458DD|nr:hypothetical protein [Micromonospora sp. NBC_00362]MCX5117267.1 hypothetical protein [Micromonospora sp. NBC_00362]
MPELGDHEPQVARVGHIENLILSGSEYRFRFVPNPLATEIPLTRIEELAQYLGITGWEFNRTHWAVKDVDLYRVLNGTVAGAAPAPRVFRLPTEVRKEADLVAVMMPFDSRFDRVYETLRHAAGDAGLRCHRADDIWVNDHIMDDVISLIWRARAVISDFTLRNANVFYETGIAHTLGRDVIQITQSANDVPFDLCSIRSVQYLDNGEGLLRLRERVADRLGNLVNRVEAS